MLETEATQPMSRMAFSDVVIVPADTSEDVEFAAIAIRDAERCHTGVGMYDLLVGIENIRTEESESASIAHDTVSRFVQHVAENDYNAHIHSSRFLIVKDAGTGERIAAGCAFPYPEYSVGRTKPGFNAALKAVCGFSEDEIEEAWKRLHFFSECWPHVECEGTWCIDAVFVTPAYRGRGIGKLLVQELMNERKLVSNDTEGASRSRIRISEGIKESMAERDCLLACAVGNTSARSMYERLGFVSMGEGESEACMEAMKTPGFAVMRTTSSSG